MYEDKGYINPLLNINNVFGDADIKLSNYIITIIAFAAPWLFWVLFTGATLGPWWLYLIISLLLGLQATLITFGQAFKKKEEYLKNQIDPYLNSSDLVNITYVSDDGIIYYANGLTGRMMTFYTQDYLNYIVFAEDFKQLFYSLGTYNFDVFGLNDTESCLTTNNIGNLKSYKDRQHILDRMAFYKSTDDYIAKHTELYQIVVLVSCLNAEFSELEKIVQNVQSSRISDKFIDFTLCDKREVVQVLSRQAGAPIDIVKYTLEKEAPIYNDDIRVVKYER